MDFKNKYLKYKNKYLNLKKKSLDQKGGAEKEDEDPQVIMKRLFNHYQKSLSPNEAAIATLKDLTKIKEDKKREEEEKERVKKIVRKLYYEKRTPGISPDDAAIATLNELKKKEEEEKRKERIREDERKEAMARKQKKNYELFLIQIKADIPEKLLFQTIKNFEDSNLISIEQAQKLKKILDTRIKEKIEK